MVRILLNSSSADGHNFRSFAKIISIVQVQRDHRGQGLSGSGTISRTVSSRTQLRVLAGLQIRRATFMGIRIDQSDRKCVITCDGEVTQQQVHELRTSFIKMLINVDEVAFELQHVTRAELPLIQLLCSAHRSATRLNKRFTFAGARPDILEKTAGSVGCLRQVGCSLDKDRTCLWTAQYDRRAS